MASVEPYDVVSKYPTLTPAEMAKIPKMEAKPVARPRKERSTPVRNPAFRENEALKNLQRQLHAEARNK